jgi:hypothetical protein
MVPILGEEVPFNLERLKRYRTTILQEVRRAAPNLAALTAEHQRLTTWLRAPRAKPLAVRGEVRTRLMAVEDALQQAAQYGESLQAELTSAQALIDVADSLHGQCTLFFFELDPSRQVD